MTRTRVKASQQTADFYWRSAVCLLFASTLLAMDKACSWPNNKSFPLFKILGYFPQLSSGSVKVALFAQSKFKTNAPIQQNLTHFHSLAVTLTQASTS